MENPSDAAMHLYPLESRIPTAASHCPISRCAKSRYAIEPRGQRREADLVFTVRVHGSAPCKPSTRAIPRQ